MNFMRKRQNHTDVRVACVSKEVEKDALFPETKFGHESSF